jgi:ribosomal protein L19E
MSKVSQQFNENSNQVGEAEKRLAIQRTFVERLRACGKETKVAEQTLEVMRDILRELYNSRSLLRRRVMTVNGAAASAPSANRVRARKMNFRKGERYGPCRRHG